MLGLFNKTEDQVAKFSPGDIAFETRDFTKVTVLAIAKKSDYASPDHVDLGIEYIIEDCNNKRRRVCEFQLVTLDEGIDKIKQRRNLDTEVTY